MSKVVNNVANLKRRNNSLHQGGNLLNRPELQKICYINKMENSIKQKENRIKQRILKKQIVENRNLLKETSNLNDEKIFLKNQNLTYKEKLNRAWNSNTAVYIYTLIVIITLFANDIKYIFFSHENDKIFNVMYILIMISFTIDLIVSSWVVDDYFWGFYFCLDLVATISMLFEVDWILTPTVNWLTISSSEEKNYRDYSLQKSSRSSRIVITISVLRIIRLIRIAKLYKNLRLWKTNSSKKQKIIMLKQTYEEYSNQKAEINELKKSKKFYYFFRK